LYYF
jgi:hypothetical protein